MSAFVANVILAVIVVTQPVEAHPTEVARPDELIVAIPTSLDCQVTLSVKSCVTGLELKVPIARNCTVSLSDCRTCDPEPGIIVRADRVRVAGPEPGLTVRVELPVIVDPARDVALAVIVTTQLLEAQPSADASPEALTEATLVSLDCQVTSPAMFWVVGLLLNVPITMNWALSPIEFRVWVPGIIVRLIRSWPVGPDPLATLRLAVPVTRPVDADEVAVTEVVPALTPVASPEAPIVAIAGVLDAHVTELVMSRVDGGCEPWV